MSNSIGDRFRVTSFGESHGPCVGVVVDGCPAGIVLDADMVQTEVDRRSSSGQPGATPRREPDRVRVLSGLYRGHTTGAPICMVIDNTSQDSRPYAQFATVPRPGHADYTAGVRYGGWNDPRGGGRFSGRITAGFVMAGAVAKAALRTAGIQVCAHTTAIGEVQARPCLPDEVPAKNRTNDVSCCDDGAAPAMSEAIEAARAAGDSIGGVVECVALGLPAGIGEPVFSSVESEVARALYSIPAVKAVEFGGGFTLSRMRGSEANDPFAVVEGRVVTTKNDAGGVLGGVTTGMPLVVRAGFKPTPSISRTQNTVDLDSMTETPLTVVGRHDVCIVPRAVVVVEAMVAVALCDLGLRCGAIPRVVR